MLAGSPVGKIQTAPMSIYRVLSSPYLISASCSALLLISFLHMGGHSTPRPFKTREHPLFHQDPLRLDHELANQVWDDQVYTANFENTGPHQDMVMAALRRPRSAHRNRFHTQVTVKHPLPNLIFIDIVRSPYPLTDSVPHE